MIVIITGPDLTGKSTLAKNLAKQLPAQYYHATRCKDAAQLNIIIDRDLKKAEVLTELQIWDRWNYPEDLIYEPLMTGNQSVLTSRVTEIESRLKQANVLVILLTANLRTLRKRYQLRGDTYINEVQLEGIRHCYQLFKSATELPVYEIDTGAFNEEQTLDLALVAINSKYREGK